MTAVPASPPRIERGRIRTRSADADWDYFPLGLWGRGYRVNGAQLARFVRLEAFQTPVAVAIWILTTFTISLVAGPETLETFVAFVVGGFAGLLASKIWFLAAVARHVRPLPPAERSLTWIELQQWDATTTARWRVAFSVLVAAALTAFGVFMMLRAIDDADVERRWLGVMTAFLMLAVGMYGAYRFVGVLRRQLGRRQVTRTGGKIV